MEYLLNQTSGIEYKNNFGTFFYSLTLWTNPGHHVYLVFLYIWFTTHPFYKQSYPILMHSFSLSHVSQVHPMPCITLTIKEVCCVKWSLPLEIAPQVPPSHLSEECFLEYSNYCIFLGWVQIYFILMYIRVWLFYEITFHFNLWVFSWPDLPFSAGRGSLRVE